MDFDIWSLMFYDVEDNLLNYLLVNIDNMECNNVLSKVYDFENFFFIIFDYFKVGYVKINLLDYIGFVVCQWYCNLGESYDIFLVDIIGIFLYMYFDDCKLVFDFYEKVKVGMECFFDGDLCICLVDGLDWWNWIYKFFMVIVYQLFNLWLELVEVNYDIIVQKEMEVEFWVVWDKVEEFNWLKFVFLVNISYEICMLLNVIVGFFDFLMMVDDLVEQEEFCWIIQKNNILFL